MKQKRRRPSERSAGRARRAKGLREGVIDPKSGEVVYYDEMDILTYERLEPVIDRVIQHEAIALARKYYEPAAIAKEKF